MKEFQPGDIVRLKSGGPDMTVRSVGAKDHEPVLCDWFDDDKKHYTKDFPPATLELVTLVEPWPGDDAPTH